MKSFSEPAARLRASSLPLRVSLTGFLIFTLIGEVTGVVMDALHTGFTPTGIAHYYRGYPPDLMFPKEFWVLMENTHFHIFIVPLVLLVLTHIIFMTRLSERAKIAITIVAYSSSLVELGSPWAVRFIAVSFVWAKLAGALVFHSTMLFLIFWPLYDAWLAPLRDPVKDTGETG